MCGGSAKSRCLPSIENGERTKPTASRPPRARVAARALIEDSPVGASRPIPCAVPPLTTRMCPDFGAVRVAVAEQVAALDRVHVEDRGGHPQRLAVAEPQAGADPRPDREVGVRRLQLLELGGGEVADPDRGGRQSGGDHVVEQPVHLGEVGALREREVQRDALEPGPGVRAHQLGRRPELAGGHAVAQHAGQPLEDEPGVGLAPEQVRHVLDPAHACGSAAGSGRGRPRPRSRTGATG